MNKLIEHALNDWRVMNASGQWWARFEAIAFESQPIVRLTYGVIHTDGTKESALRTVHYVLNADGTVGIA